MKKTVHKKALRIAAVATMAIVALVGRAAESSPAYNFLNIPSSTLAYGLGGINITNIFDDVNNIDQNPALLGAEYHKQIGLNYMHYVGGSNFAGAKFALRGSERSAWAAGIQYFGYGEIKGMDEMGNPTSNFSPKDLTVNVMYSHDITERLRGGINLKFVSSNYEQYSALALATDLGINYYDDERDLSLSVVVANLGGQIKRFNDSYDRLPIDVRLGWSQSFGTLPFRFSVTAWNLTQWKLPYYDAGDGSVDIGLKESFGSNLFRHLIFAADYMPSQNFHIGLGYNYKTRTDMSTYSRSFLSGFSIGAGLKAGRFGVGLALAQPHTGATTFMVNLSMSLSDFTN
ncbi:MAG: type IX secretion system protein PorQ [Muribaculaceae bacterium]|nr:type IX secretion system protein PorQ [Muribaculaceae bacterium]